MPTLMIMDHEGNILTKNAEDDLRKNNALSYLYFLKTKWNEEKLIKR